MTYAIAAAYSLRMPRVALTVAGLLVAVAAAGCGSAGSHVAAVEMSLAPRGAASEVPDVVGLTEADAAQVLRTAGLALNVRYVRGAPREGTALRSKPIAGDEVEMASVVKVWLSHPPRLPLPRPEQESESARLGRIVTSRPETFVGLYRDVDGVLNVAFGPGANPDEWKEPLEEASAGLTYPYEGVGHRIATCPRTHARLRAIQDEIAEDQSWNGDRRVAFGVFVDPQTCTTRVESDLLRPAEIATLVERYGTAVSFDTTRGSHPRLLPLTSRD